MTLKHLMSLKNSQSLVRMLSSEGAENLLRMHHSRLENEISSLRESCSNAKSRMQNAKSTLGAQYAELELDELKDILKGKMYQLDHINSLLEDLLTSRQFEC